MFIRRWPAKPDGGYWLEGVTRKVRMTILGKHVTLTMGDGKCHNEENANRYPEPHEGTVHVVRKAGMKIKAISCELSGAS